MSLRTPAGGDPNYVAGLAAHRAGRYDEAVVHFRAALRADPSHPDHLLALGEALLASGATGPAGRCYLYLIEQDPAHADAHFGLAKVREAEGDAMGAIAGLWHGLKLDADNTEARDRFSRLLHATGYPRAAMHEENRALAKPAGESRRDVAEATRQLSAALAACGEYADAEDALLRAALFAPDLAADLPVLGDLLERQGRLAEAADALREGLAEEPRNFAALTALGGILARLGDLDEAEDVLARALELAPGHGPALLNLANIAMERGRSERALGHLDSAIAAVPDYVEAHNNRANLLLLLGRYAEGWDEYEWRRRMPRGAPPSLNIPDWQGEPLAGSRLHVIGEQAAGDAIMFATCLGELAGAGGPVSLHCEARLGGLMRRAFPWLEVSDRLPDDSQASVRAGYAICLGSLPGLLRRAEEDFARSNPYLVADPAAAAAWRARYDALGPGLKVGFSWSGGKSHIQKRQRAMELADWLPLFRQKDACFVDLQYGDHDAARAALAARHGVSLYRPAEIAAGGDMDDFAAQVAALDLVISIDNTTVHVAGALGVPCWTLVPPSPSWRWQTGRTDSPWYPDMILFRRAANEAWGDVLARAAEALAAKAENSTGRQILPPATRTSRQFLPGDASADLSANLGIAR
jgi:tetratricopeptide (TPR) repeat protein